jgi:arsenate reductase
MEQRMTIYGLRNCDTCRKALKLLPDARLCDVRIEGIPNPVLKSAYAQFAADLVNTRSSTWRGLGPSERARDAFELLSDHPVLMKRPLIEQEGKLYLGWSSEVQAALIA